MLIRVNIIKERDRMWWRGRVGAWVRRRVGMGYVQEEGDVWECDMRGGGGCMGALMFECGREDWVW